MEIEQFVVSSDAQAGVLLGVYGHHEVAKLKEKTPIKQKEVAEMPTELFNQVDQLDGKKDGHITLAEAKKLVEALQRVMVIKNAILEMATLEEIEEGRKDQVVVACAIPEKSFLSSHTLQYVGAEDITQRSCPEGQKVVFGFDVNLFASTDPVQTTDFYRRLNEFLTRFFGEIMKNYPSEAIFGKEK